MALTFGQKDTGAGTVKASKTQMQCSNCGEIHEWAKIKEYTYAKIQGGTSIQTHEFAPGRWIAHCPNPMCGMTYMAGGKPMVIEGIDLLRLEGKTDAEIQDFMKFKAGEAAHRDKKYMNHLKEVKELTRPAPGA